MTTKKPSLSQRILRELGKRPQDWFPTPALAEACCPDAKNPRSLIHASLQSLKDNGLVVGERRGLYTYWRLA